MKVENSFRRGVLDSIPIALAYLAVSFAFGIAGSAKGVPVWAVTLISATCLTSAGQFAGLISITAGGTLIELVLSQVIINLRYSIMSIAIGQKLESRTKLWNRFLMAFGVTDEIFAMACGRKGEIGPKYFYGLMSFSWLAWTLGTFLGATASGLLPQMVMNALGIAIYGMLIAIIIPPSKHNKNIVAVIIVSVCFSLLFHYVKLFSFISSGFSIILCTLIAAGAGAVFFPVKEEDE